MLRITVLALVALTSSSGCFGPLMRVEGYGSMLEWSSLPRAVLWPVEPAGNRFGYLVAMSDGRTTDKGRIGFLDWPGALERPLAGPLGSVTILLDPEPTPGLRARCNGLLRELEAHSPEVSSYAIVAPEPLGPIASADDLGAALQRLYEAARDRRFRESLRGAVRWDLDSPRFFDPSPDCAILPVAGDTTRFFAVGNGQESIWGESEYAEGLQVVVLEKDEVDDHLARIDSSWAWIMVPRDTPFESREALTELFFALADSGPGEAYPFPPVLMWPWRSGFSRLEEPESVRLYVLPSRPFE